MRLFYTFMWWLALPLVLGRLWWRGRKEPGYRQYWGERLGIYGARAANDEPATIWVHAVSVGETRAAEPLVDALLKKYPQSRIVLTCMTPTGRATGKSLFGKHGARVVQSYLPYDMPLLVARFIRHFEPRVCILMETEVWPNLILQCQREQVPVVLANARLSERSLGKAQRFGKVIRDAAQGITLVAAQTEADALRIRELGASNVNVTGSIKFDVVIPQAALATGAQLRQQIGVRPVFLCASTREGEEGMILDAFQAARAALPPDVLLLLVPRHPQRFDEVAAMVAERGLSLQRRTALAQAGASVDPSTVVLLGDSMGEMFAYYSACDLAFIGGSLQPLGGQNLIEPAALGKPIIVGEHTFNFAQATEDCLQQGGAVRVPNSDGLMQQAVRLLADSTARGAMGAHALTFANTHRGATARTLALLPDLK
ncbi:MULTISPECIES: lipid IV(A) 3-deoxy-D-manno-octulosonic acid transferase [unclassified Duganella]|uniref:lipid IV(A) 3-deoxy-D-manno-octulosonic acid transferase n=1 Tax=unclassified Duganella TaxID=2636909 RepID=UPI0006FEAE22|nr:MULTISPECIES: lipid IV(A) 3-deoxy-D-manno-octulosonic acid transferase [unclassified Duganella]KQV53798.1 3-deoxy-D-manno-octulosonic acid transferase [Duganella sp. Root336D2]KRB83647.1 3-deoxy-D-manno-octulosonic acid transferase [Duganella sp. Root198D2]